VLSDLSTTAPMPSVSVLGADLAKQVKTSVSAAHVVGLVVDGISGQVLYSHGAQTLAPPASTTKLLTAAVALQQLGPDFAFTTSTTRVGHTLYLVGGGDPTVLRTDTSLAVPDYPRPASYADLAQRTAAALGTGSTVKLRVDTTLEDGPTKAVGWLPNYVTEGDITPPSALELDEGRLDPTNLDSERTPTPTAQAAAAFASLLKADGVHVKGQVKPETAPPTAQAVANVQSPPLSQLVQRMLTVSDNDLAEALGRAVARHDDADPSFVGAATSVTSGLKAFGVAPELVSLDDTSGLSHDDRVAPQALIDVLRAATSAQHPALRSIIEGLPIGGLTGTLSDRYRDQADRGGAGVVRAKTGTLTSVNTLAGTVVDHDGRLLMFALMASNAGNPAQTLAAIDGAAATLAECGCGSQPPP
jgi:D-alanyl-D-alanine carboxypeptidase/D-alanyl-D-alanine-endopeptidase (penicillin-binding protein 4)